MAIGIGSSWSDNIDDENDGILSHWNEPKEERDDYEPPMKYFRED